MLLLLVVLLPITDLLFTRLYALLRPQFYRPQSIFRVRNDTYHHGFRPNVSVDLEYWGPLGAPYRINSLGFRDRLVREVPPRSDRRRILLIGDSFDGDVMVEAIRSRPHIRGLLLTAEQMTPSPRHVVDNPQISNVFGRRDFESAPRGWELMMIARRLLRPGDGRPPFASFLDWGFGGFQERITGTEHRDAVVKKVERCCARTGPSRRSRPCRRA